MKKKNFNGFRSEEQYLQAFETIKEIVELWDRNTYKRDTFMVYKEDEYIQVFIDDFEIDIWENDIEIKTQKGVVDKGIINIVIALAIPLEDGDFKEFFSEL